MPRFLPDTSCMIPALCSWHERHERAAREIGRRLDAGESMVVAAPALIETHSVLTRLPAPNRLSSADASALLEANFLADMIETVALEPSAYWRLIQSAPARGIVGGNLYDAVIFACGLTATVDTILTFNERHFRPLAGSTVRIVVP